MKLLQFFATIILFNVSLLNAQDPVNLTVLPTFGNELFNGIQLSRSSGFLRLVNGTGLSGDFQPRISGMALGSSSPGLVLVGTPSLVSNQSRGILIRAGEAAPLNAGTLLQISNFTTQVMAISHDGNLGIGTQSPLSKVHIEDGDIYMEDITSGVIMKSPNGQCWRYRPDNTGSLIGVAVTCPN